MARPLILKLYILLSLVGGCAISRPQELDPKIFYRRDMKIKVEHKERTGTLVSNLKKKSYAVQVELPKNADLFLARTCHRETVFEGKGKKVKFTYTPVPGLEDKGNCYLELNAFNVEGTHSFGMIDFLHGRFGLPAQVTCNGRVYPSIGVTICQQRQQGLMKISFYKNQTLVSSKGKCGGLTSLDDGKNYTFKLKARVCTYIFKEKNGFRYHKLSTVGYESVPVRKL